MRAEERHIVRRTVAEHERKSTLKNGHTVHSPTTHELIHVTACARQIPLAVAEGKVNDVAYDQTLSNVLRRKGTVTPQVSVILDGSGAAALKPVGQCVRVANELGIGISNQQRAAARKPALNRKLERVIGAVIVALAGQAETRILRKRAVKLPVGGRRRSQGVGRARGRVKEGIGYGLQRSYLWRSHDGCGWASCAARGKRRCMRNILSSDQRT